MIFADAHSHINPIKGLGYKISEKFKSNDGWFIAYISSSPWDYFDDFNGFDSYEKMINYQINECQKSNEIGVKTACIAGFHPEDIDFLIDKVKMSPSSVLNLGLKVIEYEASLCKEGKLFGIGEVGRQHYKTQSERVAISQIILEKALEYAKDYDCMIHLHLENADTDTVRIIDYSVNKANIRNKKKIVFHHAKPSMLTEIDSLGYSATVYGIDEVLNIVLYNLPPIFMIESDFPDNPSFKKVVYPWELPRKITYFSKKYNINEEYLYKINVDNIEEAYNIRP
ncbi:putative metal-dependent hydrolase (urease superfamily) [Caldisphaera lagunensis DSM 15908]|uniref:Putative metal-dependent hydrolase (Urease superfamily) n=1 Tax=Caldisphaera lagunensis (strain DSM 15908 / JCM 11604 / ANMR 0165 / IC-154) TaxID=1056495 RepID=L0A8W6_CALLD|nr:TatD family hydrolase [Caldisphaera lagunensis]AFZ70323.1 putative metal-dependent hydrolase (urease superfamily) [Caldisphaera lagunensis DSM 15908]